MEPTYQYGYPTREKAIEAFAEHVSKGKVSTYARYGLDVVMGERLGSQFRDVYSDRWFINCHCNGGVFNLGHRNPVIIESVTRALANWDIGNHHLISTPRARLAQALCDSTGGALPGVVFGVSGGEAVDLALKLARGHSSRSGIVSAEGGYHGHTGLAVAAGDAGFREPFLSSQPGFAQVPFNDLKAMDAAVDDETAAVILEAIPATLGMPIPHDGYLRGVETLCRDRGAVLILDEVQTGLGRTGTTWYYEQEGITPDVVVTGKGLSGGIYPISATLMTAELHAFFDERPFVHISTYGGSEIGCAAALTVLDHATNPEFLARVRDVATRFTDGLTSLPFELRQRGLFMGLKFRQPGAGLIAAKLLFDQGIFAVYAGNDDSVLQFLPPLIISDSEADTVIDAVRRVFSA